MSNIEAESTNRLEDINSRILRAAHRIGSPPSTPTLVCVSKTFNRDDIVPVLEAGHRVFGENRVQEAEGKWPQLREQYPDIKLHLIGPLQTNKARDAVALFDIIETVDREKLARILRAEMDRAGRDIPCFVQVNIGEEEQKGGVAPELAVAFANICRKEYGLNIVGLMCIPPAGEAPGPYFASLAILAKEAGVENISMGMSADFETAILMGATHVRVGSAIFGSR